MKPKSLNTSIESDISMSIFTGHLRLIVLKILQNKELCGYELISEIERETGWKPSFGSIYPLLETLHKKEFVAIEKNGKVKTYSITKKGKAFLDDMVKRKDEIIDKIIENVKLFDVVCGTSHSSHVIPMLDEIKKEKATPPMGMEPELSDFRNLMFKILFEKNKEKNKKMKKLLSEMNKKLYVLTSK
jgi:DNA-binding PadR family transcriptional regulator